MYGRAWNFTYRIRAECSITCIPAFRSEEVSLVHLILKLDHPIKVPEDFIEEKRALMAQWAKDVLQDTMSIETHVVIDHLGGIQVYDDITWAIPKESVISEKIVPLIPIRSH